MFDLAFDGADILFQRRALGFRARQLCVPQIAEHREGEVEQPLGRLERFEEGFELALDDLAPDAFTRVGAPTGIAEIIGVVGIASLGPAGGVGLAALGTGDEAAQREVIPDVGPRRNLGLAAAPILHGLPRGEAHQRLVLGRDEGQAPFRDRDMARIDGTGDDLGDALGMHFAACAFGPCHLRFEEALHLDEGLQPAGRVTVQRIGDDARQRLVPHQKLAVAGHALEAVADGRAEDPVAVHGAGAHAVLGLLGVLLPLVLRDVDHQAFEEQGIGILAEADRGRFQHAAREGDGVTQIVINLTVTGQPGDVVDEDDDAVPAVLAQEVEHRFDAVAASGASGDVVAEDAHDLVFLEARKLAAACLLRGQAIALPDLLRAGHTAVDDGFLRGCGIHDLSFVFLVISDDMLVERVRECFSGTVVVGIYHGQGGGFIFSATFVPKAMAPLNRIVAEGAINGVLHDAPDCQQQVCLAGFGQVEMSDIRAIAFQIGAGHCASNRSIFGCSVEGVGNPGGFHGPPPFCKYTSIQEQYRNICTKSRTIVLYLLYGY